MTNLLHKYSNRKHGWRVKFLFDKKEQLIEDKVMVINGIGGEYMIGVEEGTPEDLIPHHLEDMVTKFLKDVEEKDMIYLAKESLMFTVLSKALRTQSQLFAPLLVRDKKHNLQMFNNHADKMVKSLKENFHSLIGEEQTEKFIEDMEQVVFNVFMKFKEVGETGRLADFQTYVMAFDSETKVAQMQVVEEKEEKPKPKKKPQAKKKAAPKKK
jgi:hypothetical protein